MIRKYPKNKKYKYLKNSIKSLANSVMIMIEAERKFGYTLLDTTNRTNELYVLYTNLQDLLIEAGILVKVELPQDKEDKAESTIKFTSFDKIDTEEDPN